MERDELSLVARNGEKLGEGGCLTGVVVSCQRMAEVREGVRLPRAVESCQKVAEMGGRGGAVASSRELPEIWGIMGKEKDGLELSWGSRMWRE